MQTPNSKCNKQDIRISKALSYILRHGAVENNLTISPEGFVPIKQLLSHRTLSNYTFDDIKRIVENNDKQRFTLRPLLQGGDWEIRANQGHSIQVDNLELTPIKDACLYTNVIHGSYFKFWTLIRRQGLFRGKRNHIHFASDLPGSSVVISGARSSAEIFIYVDLTRALQAGLEFFVSSNNVILSPGNCDGYILPEYFLKVVRASDGFELKL